MRFLRDAEHFLSSEIFALGDVLRDMGTGIIQSGGGRVAELDNGLMARLSEATGRTVIYNNLGQTVREPDAWERAKKIATETAEPIKASASKIFTPAA